MKLKSTNQEVFAATYSADNPKAPGHGYIDVSIPHSSADILKYNKGKLGRFHRVRTDSVKAA